MRRIHDRGKPRESLLGAGKGREAPGNCVCCYTNEVSHSLGDGPIHGLSRGGHEEERRVVEGTRRVSQAGERCQ